MSRAKSLIEAMSGRDFIIGQYKDGKRVATISGAGRNKGTLDATHGRRSAQRHAKEMRSRNDGHEYKVEKNLE